jgi:hypothetical protein
MRKIISTDKDPDGRVEIDTKTGEKYWMGSLVQKCPDCGVAPTNVDDCGHFGDPDCPYFGIGLEEFEKRKLNRVK